MDIDFNKYYSLDDSLILSIFDDKQFDPREIPGVMENLIIDQPTGTVLFVKKDKIQKFLDDEAVKSYRLGFKKLKPGSFIKLDKEEDFWEIVALSIPLEEYC